MKLSTCARSLIEGEPLEGPCAVICMADSPELLAKIKDSANVVARLDLIFNDANEGFQLVRPPTLEDAQRILQFVDEHHDVPHLVMQCEAGFGRSQAVMAALLKIWGRDNRVVTHRGTYNRSLYEKLLQAAGLPPEPQPLVSIAVRIKYSADRLKLFLLSMQRQRHQNWEVVAVTDGPNEGAVCLVAEMGDARVRLIETEKPLGRWGHPYRQRGLDACRGEFIGMSNDDNYYVPGYVEQMLHALENSDLALCEVLHSYFGWAAKPAGHDLGSWIARATLVRQIPWTGQDFTSDRDYIHSLRAAAKDRVAIVPRPLFIHN